MNDDAIEAAEQASADAFDAELSAALSRPARHRAPPIGPLAHYRRDDALEALDALRGRMLADGPTDRTLKGLCDRAVAVVPGADFAGVTLTRAGHRNPMTVACSDALVLDIDSDQFRAGEGPCLDAARKRRIVCVGTDDIDSHWPRFATNAVDVGVRSYLSAPLEVDAEHAGSLNLYSFDGDGFTDIDEVLVTLFVTLAEATVRSSRRTAEALSQIDGLQHRMLVQATIEQATGILMAVHAMSVDTAFTALTEQSLHENTHVGALAARIVDAAVHGPRNERPAPTTL
ncbi:MULTISPECIES: GAF and ANTAR domain-containing protein [unclassified Rhodococcus (in: high G+C Gram-positive bacteria)]|uniref:GAF and ANTAR domain-containing protein n=1 Tax=unclassified Rhodococcus (in: high G+C Gram-positive bacteria) TaxID=192944 RepID=UPI0012E90C27|nr:MULTISPECIES: GAF and ANTAR domain-containing protein [unclassified Rhodococcus (in: high G+C Gram-positive bacteria)]